MGEILQSLEEICQAHKVSLYYEEGNSYGKEGIGLQEIQKRCQILLSLGGDGTLISTFHKIPSLPILGINAGHLGFLTSVSLESMSAFLPCLFEGKYQIYTHSILSVYLDGRKIACALNEVLISKKIFPSLIEISAKIQGKQLNHYRCDGLIVATPTGSTAYNISAGGSVVYPYCKNILLTPLAPHSLTQRPMIVGSEMVLEFDVGQDSQIIIDGQKVFHFPKGSRLEICDEGEVAQLVYPNDWDYFALLREKFNWGD
ncbi:NAD(+)/NADH kinase [Helicobacter kayseriensis]|nr:NAD(+)/NADH kinase [Helicobacter kayseriensis]MCE3048288.1 NAD(+)/NADH kinase [Helicobacter kayseriensis]